MGLPKSLLDTIQSNPLAQIPLKPHGRPFPPQNHVFRVTCFSPKIPSPAGTLQDPNLGPGSPKISSAIENTKLACQETMQNPVVDIPNGAICCKLWPKAISDWVWQNLEEMCLQKQSSAFPKMGFGHKKHNIHALKKHSESNGRHSRHRLMLLQVIAANHFGLGWAKS